MNRVTITTLVSLTALIAASPALAGGKNEQATAAIAAAEAKIDAANKVGASGEVPQLQASASAALRTAKDDLSHGNKDQAIMDANHASELADRAMGEAQRVATTNAAIQQNQAAMAASAAQQDAAAANARADAAAQAARASAQDAATARATPQVVAVVTPAPAAPTTETTVTTETDAHPVVAKKAAHRVVHHHVRHTTHNNVHVKTTTTTVTH